MTELLILVSRSRVKTGMDDEYRAHVDDATELVRTEEPRVVAFTSYRSEDGAEVSTVQVHPDADSLDTHLKLFRERLSERAFRSLDSFEIDVFGSPSTAAREFFEQAAAQMPGLRVRILPRHDGGFLRSPAG